MRDKSSWFMIGGAAAFVFCLGACAVIGLAIWFAPDLPILLQRSISPQIGSVAPDFTLRSLDGSSIQVSQFKGHPVVLTFAASWCPACRGEAPTLQSLHQQHPELTVALVDSKESDSAVRGFALDFGMTHLILLDADGRVSDRYHIYAIPTTFFIDEDGAVRGVVIDQVTPALLEQKLPLIGVEP
jgi:peroxiredoxin